MITTQIITQNNEKTIKDTLESIAALRGKIVIADLGSDDATLQIARKFDPKIISYDFRDNRSYIRNEIIEPGWNFYLEPWEVLVNSFPIPSKHIPYTFQVINNDLIIKETRLWHSDFNLKFENPIFETFKNNFKTNFIEKSIIFSNYQPRVPLSLLDQWANQFPTLASPHYFKAFAMMQSQNYAEFLNEANQYLFLGGDGIPACTMRYYVALVNLYAFSNTDAAVKNLIMCLDSNILMAEFWCLLGDTYYKIHQYSRALSFYENAIILGGRRPKFDLWPMDIKKYKEYPTKMMGSCNELMDGEKLLIGSKRCSPNLV